MEISACFSEILTQAELLIKKQKEQINNAIDIPDWEEAQAVMKRSYENISKLKILKAKAGQLKTDFEESFLFSDKESNKDDSEQIKVDAVLDKAEKIEETAVTEAQEPQPFQSETNNNTDTEEDKGQPIDDYTKLDAVKSLKEPSRINGSVSNTGVLDKSARSDGSEIWLSLKEDFQNTKIKAVLIDGKKSFVKDITEALVITCEWLVKKDRVIFGRMLNASFVHGKRQRYISTRPFEISNVSDSGSSPRAFFKKLNNENIYVWTNTNSNAKASLIANMLKFYELPENTVMLAVREDYRPEEREYNSRKRQSNEAPLPDWSDDLPDASEYSTPVVHESKKIETELSESSVKSDNNNADTLVDSKFVVDLCEELILKRPYKMSLAFTSSKLGGYFSTRKNYAINHFLSPYCLSNGLWVETVGVSKQQLKYLKEFCGIKT